MNIIGIKKYKTKDGKEKIKAYLADISPDGGYEPCGTAGIRSVSDLPDGKFRSDVKHFLHRLFLIRKRKKKTQ